VSVNRKGVVAAVLSAVYPGVGHVYLREWLRAVGWLALSFVTAYVLVPGPTVQVYQHAIETGDLGALASTSLPLQAAVGVLVVRLCNVVDAYLVAVRQSAPARTTDGQPACPVCGRGLDTDLDFCPWCTTEIEWHYPEEYGHDSG